MRCTYTLTNFTSVRVKEGRFHFGTTAHRSLHTCRQLKPDTGLSNNSR